MGKRTGRIAVPGSLITAAALCFATTTAQGATLTVSSPTGSDGQQVTFTVTLSDGNNNVAGTLNDITFDPTNTPLVVGATGTGTCSTTTPQSCSSTSECPSGETCDRPTCDLPTGTCVQLCSLNTDCPSGSTCQLAMGPDCTIGTGIAEQGFFSFIKTAGCVKCPVAPDTRPDCTCTVGTDCGAMRAVVAGVNPKTVEPIPDGVLYSCKANVSTTAVNADYPLTISNVGISDPNGTAVTPADGVSGQITVGPAPAGFLVCDVVPSTGDGLGEFGDNAIRNSDVVAIFKAALTTPPPAGSARFSAMDAAPADTPPTCGGNSQILNSDVVLCFRRSLVATDPSYTRAPSGGSCTSALK